MRDSAGRSSGAERGTKTKPSVYNSGLVYMDTLCGWVIAGVLLVITDVVLVESDRTLCTISSRLGGSG